MKITVTDRADLDARSNFFTTGESEKLVYTPSPRVADARARLGPVATVVDGGRRVRMRRLSEDLADRGVERLMVEGGGVVHTQFLSDDLVDELQLVVAPFFVGDSSAPRFVDRRAVPMERRAARDARRGAPDRRRGAAALRALVAVRGRAQPNAVRNRSRNALIGHTGASRARVQARLPAPAGDLVGHLRVVGDDRDRHVVRRALAADERRGLMVAQQDDHGLVVDVVLHERDDRAHRVLDRVAVGGAGALGVAEERGLRGLLLRDAVEDRAVADVVPRDEPRDAASTARGWR